MIAEHFDVCLIKKQKPHKFINQKSGYTFWPLRVSPISRGAGGEEYPVNTLISKFTHCEH